MFFTKKITNKNASEVSHLLRPFFRSKLMEGIDDPICFAVYCINAPIGVIYGEKDEASDHFVIKQLSLADRFNGRKLEELLLNEMELSVAEGDEKEIVFSYRVKEGESSDDTMNILKENGWEEPYFLCYLISINNEVLNWEWLNFPLGRGMKTCKWSQLSPKIIDRLVNEQNATQTFPDYIPGYLNKNKFSHEISAALVLENNIVGWMFVEITDNNNFIYSYVYIKPQFQRSGKSTANLFKETVSNVDIPSDFSILFSVMPDNKRLFYFMTRKWKPYISSIYKEYNSIKKL